MASNQSKDSNAAFKNVPRPRTTDLRHPQEAKNGLVRDNPVKYSDKSLIKHR
ncbi:hypothetical protein PQR75_06590 [Paraburkholderia fungorum]|uniref:hypothetical protein n=1 Tax=Paraburkholderia fungorum TaxID=134537 RepID=UPI0038B9809C